MHDFSKQAAVPGHPLWEQLTRRERPLYTRQDDIRSPFTRDYTRILHSMAYRRLKHKTQVFFNINNDHICTRMEHVSHVESVSESIARALHLNEELTRAISLGHDLGHAPFGHHGETVLQDLSQHYLGKDFWHEQNGLRFVDHVELLKDNYGCSRNLDLTYAVRDGILSHCGEVDENGLRPRDISIPLEDFDAPGKYQSVTWEGCVVKLADKIAYIGRDIEDATRLGFLDAAAQAQLLQMARANDEHVMNTTVIMHNLMIDLSRNSSPERGIVLSQTFHRQLTELKAFNTEYIYHHPRLKPFQHYAQLVLTEIFQALMSLYHGPDTLRSMEDRGKFTPNLVQSFSGWLACYCDSSILPEGPLREKAALCRNEKLYGQLDLRRDYIQAVIDYISGMTDRFAIQLFQELLEY